MESMEMADKAPSDARCVRGILAVVRVRRRGLVMGRQLIVSGKEYKRG